MLKSGGVPFAANVAAANIAPILWRDNKCGFRVDARFAIDAQSKDMILYIKHAKWGNWQDIE